MSSEKKASQFFRVQLWIKVIRIPIEERSRSCSFNNFWLKAPSLQRSLSQSVARTLRELKTWQVKYAWILSTGAWGAYLNIQKSYQTSWDEMCTKLTITLSAIILSHAIFYVRQVEIIAFVDGNKYTLQHTKWLCTIFSFHIWGSVCVRYLMCSSCYQIYIKFPFYELRARACVCVCITAMFLTLMLPFFIHQSHIGYWSYNGLSLLNIYFLGEKKIQQPI